jgi:hypothetical protein
VSSQTPELATDLAPTENDRILQAEAFVRAYCGWHIAPSRSETLILDGPGGHTLCLPSLHVSSIDAITENGNDLTEGDDYTWSVAGIVHRVGWASGWNMATDNLGGPNSVPGWGWWTCQLQGISVDLTHGFDEVPAEITGAVQAIAQQLVDNPGGLEQQSVGPFMERYGTTGGGGLLFTLGAGSQLSALEPYRLPRRP